MADPDIEAQSAAAGKSLELEGSGIKRHDTNFGSHGVRITFKDLTYHVANMKNKKERAYLLNKVNGWFLPNQMAALVCDR